MSYTLDAEDRFGEPLEYSLGRNVTRQTYNECAADQGMEFYASIWVLVHHVTTRPGQSVSLIKLVLPTAAMDAIDSLGHNGQTGGELGTVSLEVVLYQGYRNTPVSARKMSKQ